MKQASRVASHSQLEGHQQKVDGHRCGVWAGASPSPRVEVWGWDVPLLKIWNFIVGNATYFRAFSCNFKLSVNLLQFDKLTTETHSHSYHSDPSEKNDERVHWQSDNDCSQSDWHDSRIFQRLQCFKRYSIQQNFHLGGTARNSGARPPMRRAWNRLVKNQGITQSHSFELWSLL